MPAHAQVVVAAPDGDVTSGAHLLGDGEVRAAPAHLLEDAVRVVTLLQLDLRPEVVVVIKDGRTIIVCSQHNTKHHIIEYRKLLHLSTWTV